MKTLRTATLGFNFTGSYKTKTLYVGTEEVLL